MPVPIPSLDLMKAYGEDPNVLLNILRFTAPFDFSGSPTLTLPNGLDAVGMPLSMQLVGAHFFPKTCSPVLVMPSRWRPAGIGADRRLA